MYAFICVTPPGQTKNGTDLKLGTHTPNDPDGRYPLKTVVSRGFSAYLFDFLVS